IEVSRENISQYASENNIGFHNDSTNATTKYARNKVRHLVMPLLQEINISAKENILKSVSYFSDTEKIMNDYIKWAKKLVLVHEDGITKINVEKLNTTPAPSTILFEILIDEGVPKPLSSEAAGLLNAQTGKFCIFEDWQLTRNRDFIEIHQNNTSDDCEEITIEFIGELKKYGFEISKARCDDDFVFEKNPNTAYLDCKKLKFPLTLRKWQFGDRFMPLGMKGSRKLSDFLKDEKIPPAQKSRVRILLSDNKIAWVVGMRIDDRFKFDKNTKEVFILKANN
ncbi:MAG: tRNA lysidine(34) synthetase TilS, partial [Bacteroidales bacterium]|nr:tRNA lysidine(34) synthetase TilS [Bacteroidales bacterium]